MTEIAEGALVKEGNAESVGVVEGVRTVDTNDSEAGTLEVPDRELLVVVAF